MAQCATQVIADNGMANKIKLIRKRSTDLQVGPGKMKRLGWETASNALYLKRRIFSHLALLFSNT